MKAVRYPIHDSIGFLISLTHRKLVPLLDARVSQAGISYGMWYFLRVLWEGDGISQREIADRVGMTTPTALAALRKLERLELVELQQDPDDGRRTRVLLTKKGRDLNRDLVPKVAQINEIALDGLTDAEVEALRRALTKIQANADAHR